MTQPEIEVRSAWRQIAGHHHDGYIDDVLSRYAEPHRHYHNATHIMFVLRHLHDVSRASNVPLSHETIAAALYHDAIYDASAGDNEACSAVLAAKDLAEIGWTAQQCGSVSALILATAGHLADDAATSADVAASVASTDSAASPDDTAMLLDADLAILGADPGAYQAYANGVRAEYAHVDDVQWRAGRTAVLMRFLRRDRLFITDHMHATFDHRARANMEAELATIRSE
jgi:predicted metal-dependent HD superfamily phosphohydrolase